MNLKFTKTPFHFIRHINEELRVPLDFDLKFPLKSGRMYVKT